MMSNPPSIESCQQLHNLAPGWTDTYFNYWDMSRAVLNGGIDPQAWRNNDRGIELHPKDFTPADRDKRFVCPCYDTDYLLEKLPTNIVLRRIAGGSLWVAEIPELEIGLWAGGCSDKLLIKALIRLATTLIQEGKLKP